MLLLFSRYIVYNSFATPWIIAYHCRLLCLWKFSGKIPEWVAFSFPRESSWLRDHADISCIGRQILYHWAMWEALKQYWWESKNVQLLSNQSHFAPSTASQNSWDFKVCSKDIFTRQWRELGVEGGGRISNRESRSVSPRQGYWGIYGLRNKAVG